MQVAAPGTPERRAQDLAMMRSPSNWPIWPRLPVKKPGSWDHGFLFNGSLTDDTVEPKIYMKNIFGGIPTSDDPVKEYASLEAIVDDGWTVD